MLITGVRALAKEASLVLRSKNGALSLQPEEDGCASYSAEHSREGQHGVYFPNRTSRERWWCFVVFSATLSLGEFI